MTNTPPSGSTWRAWRLTIPNLSMNEVARRSGIGSGRLSIIERGVAPTEDEARKLRAVLVTAGAPTKWVEICRGGPTADCGNPEWHESHEMNGGAA